MHNHIRAPMTSADRLEAVAVGAARAPCATVDALAPAAASVMPALGDHVHLILHAGID
jgi:hypothetical protein